ncbi:tbc1 domain family member 13-like [Anaeramoeba ignava]|uniref:Tbc1 domain family member 13-like n=1 Tax=Anaeramoeba ignava TaxID=1746090 RepID=A0A9Q0R894_ANAIG|nr:tbc1 domain family member 13-like [Anaeramoeba ignava]
MSRSYSCGNIYDYDCGTSCGWKIIHVSNWEEIDESQLKETMDFLNLTNKEKKQEICEILYLFAKTNPEIGYYQAMSQILIPIYHLFSTDPDLDFKRNATQDSFFCFSNLINEIKKDLKLFQKKIKIEKNPILFNVDRLIRFYDLELSNHFRKLSITPQIYSLGWISLLFTGTFKISTVFRIWEIFFGKEERFKFLPFICASIPIMIRDFLLKENEYGTMELLQKFKMIDTKQLIELSIKIFENYEESKKQKKKKSFWK